MLSADEIREFWSLFKQQLTGQMPIAEVVQKSLELFGNDRKHLLVSALLMLENGRTIEFYRNATIHSRC